MASRMAMECGEHMGTTLVSSANETARGSGLVRFDVAYTDCPHCQASASVAVARRFRGSVQTGAPRTTPCTECGALPGDAR